MSDGILDELKGRSTMCWRHEKFLELKANGTATADDICPGSLNCMAGCHDTRDLIGLDNWKTGAVCPKVPGINLTDFGLVPLSTQNDRKQKLLEALKIEKELLEKQKSLDELLSDSSPVLGSGKVSSISPTSTWSKPPSVVPIEVTVDTLAQDSSLSIINNKAYSVSDEPLATFGSLKLVAMKRIYTDAELDEFDKMICVNHYQRFSIVTSTMSTWTASTWTASTWTASTWTASTWTAVHG